MECLCGVAGCLAMPRIVSLASRMKLHITGARFSSTRCEVDQNEEAAYAGSVHGCPAYDQVPLRMTGGTLHVPKCGADTGLAIFVLPGTGRIFNVLPLQDQLRNHGINIDVVGVDYCAYGAGYERNVRDRWFPWFPNEVSIDDMSASLLEALEVTSGRYKKAMVIANSRAAVAVLQLLSRNDVKAASIKALSKVQGFWLTNPVVAFKDGHGVNAIVNSRIPTCLFTFIDKVLGLGPLRVQTSNSQDWFYFTDPLKKKLGEYKPCFLTSTNPSGTVISFPRYQSPESPLRVMHAAEVVHICRGWSQRKFRKQLLVKAPGSPVAPVWFSVNYGKNEWHCGAQASKALLNDWGAQEAGALQTHEEFLYETPEQWAQAFGVLRGLISQALNV